MREHEGVEDGVDVSRGVDKLQKKHSFAVGENEQLSSVEASAVPAFIFSPRRSLEDSSRRTPEAFANDAAELFGGGGGGGGGGGPTNQMSRQENGNGDFDDYNAATQITPMGLSLSADPT